MRLSSSTAIAASGSLWLMQALAASNPWHLDYSSDVHCPSREDFVQQLQGRLRTSSAVSLTQLHVAVVAGDAGYVGTLELIDPQGNRVQREVSGPVCSEVTQAIALVAAVSIDGAATSATSLPVGVGSARRSAPLSTPQPIVADGTGDASSLDVATPKEPKESRQVTPNRKANAFSFGAVGGLHAGISPSVTPTVGFSVGSHPSRTWGWPEYRLAGLVAKSKPRSVQFANGAGEAEFLWLSVRAVASPVAIGTAGLRLGPGALLEVGVLKGFGRSSAGEGSSSGWWVAPGLVLTGTAQIDAIRVGLIGGTVLPIVRERFKFRPDFTAFRPPSLAFVGEIGVTWTFD